MANHAMRHVLMLGMFGVMSCCFSSTNFLIVQLAVVLSVCFFLDDESIFLGKNLKSRPLWNNNRILDNATEQNGAGLSITQKSIRVRKVCAKGNVSGFVVEVCLDRSDRTDLWELFIVGQH